MNAETGDKLVSLSILIARREVDLPDFSGSFWLNYISIKNMEVSYETQYDDSFDDHMNIKL